MSAENFKLFYSEKYVFGEEGIGRHLCACPAKHLLDFGLFTIVDLNEDNRPFYKKSILNETEKDLPKRVADACLRMMIWDLSILADYGVPEEQNDRLSNILVFCYRTFCHSKYDTKEEYLDVFRKEFALHPGKTRGDKNFMIYWIKEIYKRQGFDMEEWKDFESTL